MEAIANEVALLRRRFPRSVAWGLSHRHWVLLCRRGFCLHPRLHLVFRAAVWAFEPAFQLNHVVGGLGDWFYLRGNRRRPTVLTVATMTGPVDKSLLDRVDRLVVECPAGAEHLGRLGISGERVRLIYPPVDLDRFVPTEAPDGPFTVLFASSPDNASWLEARGVPAILDAAALRPHMRFRLVWRPWGDSLPRVQQWVAERGLANIEIVVGRFDDMRLHYRECHVTVAPFVDLERCKPAPNSVIESLACGRPALVSPEVGLADAVRTGRAGIVSASTGDALAEGLDRIQAEWNTLSARARGLAESCFSQDRFVRGYEEVYADLLGTRAG